MKLPFTEKFLWDVYNLVEGVSDVYTAFSVPSLKDVLYPEMAQIYKTIKRKQSRKEFARFIYYLKRRGYIKLEKRKTIKIIILTHKGWEKVLKINLRKEKIKTRRDRRWIMIVFDIPEKQRRMRDFFRNCLKQLGFQMFQQSIWLSPNDVLDKVENIAQGLKIEKYIKLMLVEEVEFKDKK